MASSTTNTSSHLLGSRASLPLDGEYASTRAGTVFCIEQGTEVETRCRRYAGKQAQGYRCDLSARIISLHHAGGSVLVFQELPRDRKKIGFPHRHHYAELTAFPSSPNSLAVPFMASIQNAMCSSRSTPRSAAPVVMSLRLTLRARLCLSSFFGRTWLPLQPATCS